MNPYDITTLDPSLTQANPIDPLALLGISPAMVGTFFLASSLLTLLFFVLFILNIVRNWKMQKAIFQLQKDVHEMNEREKNRHVAPAQPETHTSEHASI